MNENDKNLARNVHGRDGASVRIWRRIQVRRYRSTFEQNVEVYPKRIVMNVYMSFKWHGIKNRSGIFRKDNDFWILQRNGKSLRMKFNPVKHNCFFYCCTVHFEDSLSITPTNALLQHSLIKIDQFKNIYIKTLSPLRHVSTAYCLSSSRSTCPS